MIKISSHVKEIYMMQIVIIKIELYNKSISSLTFSNLIPSLYFQDFEGKISNIMH